MKFSKEAGTAGVTIPKSAMKLCSLSDARELELHTMDGVAVLVKRKMTAMELLTVIHNLNQLAGGLLALLAYACDDCVGCEDECPFSQESHDIRLPKYLLEAAEIPEGAKLRAEPVPDTGHIIVSALETGRDLGNVPEALLNCIAGCGVCLVSLSELLGSGEVIYGAH